MSLSFKINNLTLSRSGKSLFKDFSLEVESSKVLALIAPSGRGKTTLLDYISGLLFNNDLEIDKKMKNNIVFYDENGNSSNSSKSISYLFQEDRLIPQASIIQNIMFPLENLMSKEKAFARAMFYLEKTGLLSKQNARPSTLSGGERQRAAIARAFAFPSKILLLDEPFQGQDIRTKNSLLDLFLQMQSQEKRTVVFVTHEIREAVKSSDRIIVLDSSPVKILLDIQNTPESNPFFDLSAQGNNTEHQIINLLW